ncbi:isochorismatase family protein [Lysobacter sp. TAB13]|uniref:isochorismatase family protein n=1 Tax=Lysobacter sp. TAB13 TaxID=3233065 RepID=UPI003F9DF513
MASALVVIDVQRGLFDTRPPPAEAEAVIARINALAERARAYPVTVAADAHTTHDKPHADAAFIRAHHNLTLADVTSFGPVIRAQAAEAIDFAC